MPFLGGSEANSRIACVFHQYGTCVGFSFWLLFFSSFICIRCPHARRERKRRRKQLNSSSQNFCLFNKKKKNTFFTAECTARSFTIFGWCGWKLLVADSFGVEAKAINKRPKRKRKRKKPSSSSSSPYVYRSVKEVDSDGSKKKEQRKNGELCYMAIVMPLQPPLA